MPNVLRRRRMGRVAFSPSQIPGLVTWLVADDLTGLGDATAIDTWADRSPLVLTYTGTTTTRPIVKVNILNGHTVARFDGTDDFLTTPDNDQLDFGTGSFAAFALFIPNVVGAFKVVWAKGTTASADNIRLFINTSNRPQIFWGSDAQNYGAPAVTALSSGVASVVEWSLDAAAAIEETANNDSQVAAAVTVSGTGANAQAARIGRDATPNYQYQFDLCQLILYRGLLSSGQKNAVRRYLANLGGIAL